jgi:hypothetical protein
MGPNRIRNILGFNGIVKFLGSSGIICDGAGMMPGFGPKT